MKESLTNHARAELLNAFGPFRDSIWIDRATVYPQSRGLDEVERRPQRPAARPASDGQMRLTCAVFLSHAGQQKAARRIIATLRRNGIPHDPMHPFSAPFTCATQLGSDFLPLWMTQDCMGQAAGRA